MTTFVYTAKKNTAETVKGRINAQSQEEAIDLINQLGLLPVNVEAEVEDKYDLGKPKKVKSKDRYVFSRQLANLLKSGVSILHALTIIEDQTVDPYFKKVIAHIAFLVRNGKSFSEALSVYGHIFSRLYISMVKAGEETGDLQEMLVNVATYQQHQEEINSKVKMALVYPLIMGAVGFGTVLFILVYVLPKMADLFESLGDALPLPTMILLNFSEILRFGGLWVVLIGAILILVLKKWISSQKGKFASSRFMLRTPIFGDIVLKSELARFTRTLSLLLKSGIPIIQALDTAIPTLNNEIIKTQLLISRDDLTAGGSFGEAIKKSPSIPPMMGHLISVGEESGNLDEVLSEITETYEQETQDTIKVMTTLLEPLMILVIGLVVGLIVFAMLLPIFQMDVLAA